MEKSASKKKDWPGLAIDARARAARSKINLKISVCSIWVECPHRSPPSMHGGSSVSAAGTPADRSPQSNHRLNQDLTYVRTESPEPTDDSKKPVPTVGRSGKRFLAIWARTFDLKVAGEQTPAFEPPLGLGRAMATVKTKNSDTEVHCELDAMDLLPHSKQQKKKWKTTTTMVDRIRRHALGRLPNKYTIKTN